MAHDDDFDPFIAEIARELRAPVSIGSNRNYWGGVLATGSDSDHEGEVSHDHVFYGK